MRYVKFVVYVYGIDLDRARTTVELLYRGARYRPGSRITAYPGDEIGLVGHVYLTASASGRAVMTAQLAGQPEVRSEVTFERTTYFMIPSTGYMKIIIPKELPPGSYRLTVVLKVYDYVCA